MRTNNPRRIIGLVAALTLLTSLAPLAVSAEVPLTGGSLLSGSADATTTAVPKVQQRLVEQAAALGQDDRIDVIVTAHEFQGLDVLDALGVPHRRLRSEPIALATPTVAQLAQLAASPGLLSLWSRESYDLFLTESTQIVGADRVEQVLGIDGSGVAVAVVDTGIDATHPDLPWHDKVVANYEVVANPFDPVGDVLVDMPDTDDDGHGTHVASTVAGRDADGDGLRDGVAPGAMLYGYSVNVSLTVDSPRILVAFDDIIQKRDAGAPIVAISNSWGGGAGAYDPADPLSILTRAAFDAGIAVVFAAGNAGQAGGELNTASRQCTMPWVVCVGATTKPGQLVQFSSRGRPPTDTTVVMPNGAGYEIPGGNHDRFLGQTFDVGVFRPTVSAPGVNIEAACAKASCGVPGDYTSLSGTSMATPHVSGVVALMAAARLEATGSVDLGSATMIDILEGTARPMPGWELWEAGAGEVDAYGAVLAVRDPSLLTAANLTATPAPLDSASTATFSGTVAPSSCTTGVGGTEHLVEVPAGTADLSLTLRWSGAENNLYMYAWRPGTDPDTDGAGRADQESWGLLEGLGPRLATFRNGSLPYPGPGSWTVRVCGRVNAAPVAYTLDADLRNAARPDVDVKTTSTLGEDEVRLTGSATFPARPSTGLTRSQVTGTALPLREPGVPTPYYLHGTVAEGDKHLDQWFGGPGPYFDQTEPTDPVSQFQTGGWYGNAEYAGNFLLAYWRAPFEGTIQGDIPITVWVSSATQTLGGQLTFTLFDVPDGHLGIDVPVIARTTISAAGVGPVPTQVDAVLSNVVYSMGEGRELILSISGTFIDTDVFSVWYDSTVHPSGFTLPLAPGDVILPRPTGVQATDLVAKGAVISWDSVAGAESYLVYRSETPDELGRIVARVTPTGADRESVTDRNARAGEPAYYRVATRSKAEGVSEPSDAAYAIPIMDRRWVEVQAGRGPWELASGTSSWRITLQRAAGPGSDPGVFTVRSRTWAGASIELRLDA
jgi:serine protease AprX